MGKGAPADSRRSCSSSRFSFVSRPGNTTERCNCRSARLVMLTHVDPPPKHARSRVFSCARHWWGDGVRFALGAGMLPPLRETFVVCISLGAALATACGSDPAGVAYTPPQGFDRTAKPGAEKTPPEAPPVLSTQWKFERVHAGYEGHIMLAPAPLIVSVAGPEAFLSRRGPSGWNEEYVGPVGGGPRLLDGGAFPAVFKSGVGASVWRRTASSAYGPVPLESKGGDVHVIFSTADRVAYAEDVSHAVEPNSSEHPIVAAGSYLFEMRLVGDQPTSRMVDAYGPDHMPYAARAVAVDAQDQLHAFWSGQAYSETFEHCVYAPSPSCSTLKVSPTQAIASLRIDQGKVRYVSRGGQGDLLLGQDGAPSHAVDSKVAEIFDVAYGRDGTAYILYSKEADGKRPWGDTVRELWLLVNQAQNPHRELLGQVDGRGAIALDDEGQPHILFVEADVKGQDFDTAEFWTMYGERVP